MKAVTRIKYCPPENLVVKEIDKPIPKSDEVLLRVHYTTVNRTDCAIVRGKPYLMRAFVGLFRPKSIVPGTDFSGEIVEIGNKVSSFSIGDKVWGLNDEGLASQAEYMVIKENKSIVKKPENISLKDVVACAEGAHYAYNFVQKFKPKKGAKILINGATGAIGSAAIQLLKHFGCYVTAVGNTKNKELVLSLGADKFINYEKEDFTKDDEIYSFIYDSVGKSAFYLCRHLLKKGGIYISSELGPYAQNIYLPLLTRFSNKRVIFPIPTKTKRSLLFLNQLIKNNEFKAVIDKVYPMDEISEAYKYVETGEKTGNVIIRYI